MPSPSMLFRSFIDNIPLRLMEYGDISKYSYSVEKESMVIGDMGKKTISSITLEPGEEYNITIEESKGIMVMVDGVVESPSGSGTATLKVELDNVTNMDNPLVYNTYGGGKTGATGFIEAHPDNSIETITLINDGDTSISIGSIDIKYIKRSMNNPVAMFFRYISYPGDYRPYIIYPIDIPLLYTSRARVGMLLRKIVPNNPVSGGEIPAIWGSRSNVIYVSHSPKDNAESWLADWLFDSRPVEGVKSAINTTAGNSNNTPGFGDANGVRFFFADNTYNFESLETVIFGYAVIYQFIKPNKTKIYPPNREIRDLFLFLHRNPVTEFSSFIVPPYGTHVKLIRMWSDQTYNYTISYAWNEGSDGLSAWLTTLSSASSVSGLQEVDVSSKPYTLYKVTLTLSASGYARIIAYIS